MQGSNYIIYILYGVEIQYKVTQSNKERRLKYIDYLRGDDLMLIYCSHPGGLSPTNINCRVRTNSLQLSKEILQNNMSDNTPYN